MKSTRKSVVLGVAVLLSLAATTPVFAASNNWIDTGTNVYTTGRVAIGVAPSNASAFFTLYPTTSGVNFKLYEYAFFGSIYGSWRTVIGANVKANEGTVDQMETAVTHATYGGAAIEMAPNTGFIFHTKPAPSTAGTAFSSPRMVIDLAGNVGIGTTSPTVRLHVVGNTHIEGTLTGTNIQATYQDVAEWVDSPNDLEAGTVVVLDPSQNNAVIAADSPYDTSVAGVVSAQPGITLGVKGDKKEMVATTGRVRVKADTTGGPIAVGDLLVTSSNPGRAMRSNPIDVGGAKIHRPGTIIGKALEPLADGEGEILVLLSMQ